MIDDSNVCTIARCTIFINCSGWKFNVNESSVWNSGTDGDYNETLKWEIDTKSEQFHVQHPVPSVIFRYFSVITTNNNINNRLTDWQHSEKSEPVQAHSTHTHTAFVNLIQNVFCLNWNFEAWTFFFFVFAPRRNVLLKCQCCCRHRFNTIFVFVLSSEYKHIWIVKWLLKANRNDGRGAENEDSWWRHEIYRVIALLSGTVWSQFFLDIWNNGRRRMKLEANNNSLNEWFTRCIFCFVCLMLEASSFGAR